MKVHYISDIHLEEYEKVTQVTSNSKGFSLVKEEEREVLVLAGDIGYPRTELYQSFLRVCGELWKHVVVICGNHEYYSSVKYTPTIEEVHLMILQNAPSNVYFLQNQTVTLEGVKFAGATLWYDNSLNETNGFNDYKYIYVRPVTKPLNGVFSKRWKAPFKLQPQDVTAFYEESVKFFEETLQDGVPTVCVSHHPPTRVYSRDFGYGSDLDDLVNSPSVVKWVCGHNHQEVSREEGKVTLNTFGYKGQFEQSKLWFKDTKDLPPLTFKSFDV